MPRRSVIAGVRCATDAQHPAANATAAKMDCCCHNKIGISNRILLFRLDGSISRRGPDRPAVTPTARWRWNRAAIFSSAHTHQPKSL